jgi:hypothetical protein
MFSHFTVIMVQAGTIFHVTTCNTLCQHFAWWQEMLCLLLYQFAKNLQSIFLTAYHEVLQILGMKIHN